jgi:hypothetical protein
MLIMLALRFGVLQSFFHNGIYEIQCGHVYEKTRIMVIGPFWINEFIFPISSDERISITVDLDLDLDRLDRVRAIPYYRMLFYLCL